MALAGTPALVVLRLQKEIAAALLKLQMQHFLATQSARGIEIKTPEYARTIDREIDVSKTVIGKAGVRAE